MCQFCTANLINDIIVMFLLSVLGNKLNHNVTNKKKHHVKWCFL